MPPAALLAALTGLGPAAIPAVLLAAAVFAAVHHAEVIAHRVGEPYGTLVLAVAVTVVEAGLILTLMAAGDEETAALARDSMFAALMIVCTGVVGACLVVGGTRFGEQQFQLQGASAKLAVLTTLATLALVMPNYTVSADGPRYTASQLAFVAIVAAALWALFVFVQTVRHRDYFLPAEEDAGDEAHAEPPSVRATALAGLLLLVALGAVVLLAKALAPTIEAAIDAGGLPTAVLGVVVAGLVLLPESVAAVRAAARNRLQTSLNLALGSGIATIGLTIPVVATAVLLFGWDLVLGLEAKEMVLLALTLLVSSVTLATGRTTVLQGGVHLVIFAAFLFLTLVP